MDQVGLSQPISGQNNLPRFIRFLNGFLLDVFHALAVNLHAVVGLLNVEQNM
jgi:hypothetical protein